MSGCSGRERGDLRAVTEPGPVGQPSEAEDRDPGSREAGDRNPDGRSRREAGGRDPDGRSRRKAGGRDPDDRSLREAGGRDPGDRDPVVRRRRADRLGRPGTEASRVLGAAPRPALSDEQHRQLALARRAARVTGLILPGALTLAGLAVQAAWLPRLPDPVAIHWDASGAPDGFGSPWTNIAMLAAVSAVLLSLYLLQELQALRGLRARLRPRAPTWTSMHRFLPAAVLGAVTLMQVMLAGASASQLDARDAAQTGPVLGALLGGLVVGLAVGVFAFFAQPKVRIDPSARDAPLEPLELGESERAVWIRDVSAGRWLLGVLAGAAALLAALAMWTFGLEPVAGWITLATFALVVVAAVVCGRFRVRIDAAGIEARSVLGWPRVRVAAADVLRVTVANIDPLGEYGGWGWRIAPDRTGVVMRSGEGIVVTRRNGRIFGVTVDDAPSGAAMLALAAQRAAQSGPADQAQPARPADRAGQTNHENADGERGAS